jgi:hypothetical protein
MRRWLVFGAALAAATGLAGAALAVGPWPGLAPSVQGSTGVRYTARPAGGSTTVKAMRDGKVVASATFDGAFGIPAVTSAGAAGGLSPDGRLLVLAEPPRYNGLRERSRFLVVSTRTLSLVQKIELPGEFGFDALSPNGATLYVIQHVASNDLVRYVVRAYDLHTRRLLAQPIVDKRTPDETMRGYPVARTTSQRGDWVYTLYTRGTDAKGVFVHALNASGRYALCVDLPRWPGGTDIWSARLEVSGRKLLVRAANSALVATIDMDKLRVL